MAGKKLTREEILRRCHEAHGDKYDYSLATFLNKKDKSIIICGIHGQFRQNYISHYNGQGCPICAARGYDDSVKTQADVNEFWIKKFREVHGDRYDYVKMNYVVSTEKVTITCREHGDFEQTPGMHVQGKGCPKCKMDVIKDKLRTTPEEFLKRAREVHGDKYQYDVTGFVDMKSIVRIRCKEHGWFEQRCQYHTSGHGCPECGKVNSGAKRKIQREVLLAKFREVHGDFYNYDKVEYHYKVEPVIITCPLHGDFEQTPENHMNGCGCPKCAIEKNAEKRKYGFDDFLQLARKVHGDKYEYHEEDFKSYTNDKTRITCKQHGDFWMMPLNHIHNKQDCPKCHRNVSKVESRLFECVKNLFPDAIQSDKSILLGKEIDIFVPSKNLAFEFNGLYWHNELNVEPEYHLHKTVECEKRGIRLFHIFEDEWEKKSELIISMIRYLAGKTTRSVMARKCEIVTVGNDEAKEFYDANHLQGHVFASIHYGLRYNGELVCMESFSRKDDDWFLVRFACKRDLTVNGGASKLLKHFERVFKPTKLISYVDRRWSVGDMYGKLGFKLKHVTQPSYHIVVDGERRHRFGYRKEVLVNKYGCPVGMSEHEFCLSQRWYRIYNCGVMVMEKMYNDEK